MIITSISRLSNKLASSVKLPSMPEVPTFKQAGYKGTILAQYRGLWFSNENSNAQANFYSKLMKKIAKTQSFKDYVAKNLGNLVKDTDLSKFIL